MQTIILIRHGYPTTWDEPPKPRGTPLHLKLDPGLAAIGIQQAQATADHLQALGVLDQIMSSPFRRCLETADRIATACKSGIAPDWRLGEVLLSQVLGSPFSPGSAMDPEWEDRRDGAGKPAHPESDRTLQERTMKVMLALKARKPLAQRIAIISHEIVLKQLITAMTGRSPTVDWHPCAIATYTRATPADRTWKLIGPLATYAHLGTHDRCEPADQITVKYHPLDSQS
jgi:broad specificity phosphatase PhoE